jgi:hypothetical protein
MAAVYPKAVIVGGLTDVILSNILGLMFHVYVEHSQGLEEVPAEQLTAAVIAATQASFALLVAQYFIGGLCSILGGYAAAAIAKSNELLNGVLSSWLCVGIGAYAIFSNAFGIPLWQLIVFVVTTPLVYLAGAYLWLRRNRPLLFASNSSLERTREG